MTAHSKQFAMAVFLLCVAMIVGAKWGKNPSSKERDEIREEMARMRHEQKSLATRDELDRLTEEYTKKLDENNATIDGKLNKSIEEYGNFKNGVGSRIKQWEDESKKEITRIANEQKSFATRDEIHRVQEEYAKKFARSESNSTKYESRLTELTEEYRKFKEEASPKLQQFSKYLDLVKKEQEKQARFLGNRAGEEREYLGIKFCWIPAGTFKMGSPPTEKDRDISENQVEVQLTYGFWMAKYETTQEEYQRVMGANPSHFSATGVGKEKVAGVDTARFPVEQVNWYDAMEYCQKLTTLAHSSRVLPRDWRFTLPTEAQWEYACRAGTTTPFHFGEILNGNQANTNGDSPYGTAEKGPNLQRTTPVGSYPANDWKLHDMHGNVWEWCLDVKKDDLISGADPVAMDGGALRVLRGGCWDFNGRYCRSALRFRSDPAYRDSDFGFRAVAVPAK